MSKIDLISSDWVDLVFEGRNKAYGAYRLRKSTTKRNILAMVAVVILLVVAFIILTVKNFVDEQRAKVAMTQVAELTNYDQPKKKAEVKQKKVEVEPERVVERVKSSIKFTAPVIKKDEEVKEEDEIKLEEVEKSNKAVGAFNVQGNDEVGGEVLKAKDDIKAPEPPKHVEEEKVFDVVEQMPSFPGGTGALMKFLNENIHYPVVAQENGVQGRVVISFVVERDGHITDVQVARSVDPSLDKEAQRVVKSMPKWIPGKQNGSAVRVKFNVPVAFRLQ